MICPNCHTDANPAGAQVCVICGAPLDGCAGCVNESAARDQDCCWNCSRNRLRTRRDLYQPKPAGDHHG